MLLTCSGKKAATGFWEEDVGLRRLDCRAGLEEDAAARGSLREEEFLGLVAVDAVGMMSLASGEGTCVAKRLNCCLINDYQ